MGKKGRLIIVEGEDGVGKSTQVKLVVENLEALGKKVKSVKFPFYDSPTGKIVKSYLNSEFGAASKLNSKLSCALYALDRAAHKPMLENLLNENDFVILDRYYYSNIALQSAKEDSSYIDIKNFVLELEEQALGLPKGHVLYLNNNGSQSTAERLKGRTVSDSTDKATLDGHESDSEYMARVGDIYRTMAHEFNFTTVNIFAGNGERKTEIDLAIEIEKKLEI